MEEASAPGASVLGDDRMRRVVALVRQLRNPAHTISGLVELLAETPEHAATFAATLGSQTVSLLETIDQLAQLVDPAPRTTLSSPPHAAGRDRRVVLVVDDSPVNQLLVTSQLAKLGVESVTAASGARALELLAAQRFDAVLMDWHMPGMDGLETAAALRRRESAMGLARTPVIAVTARAMRGDRERCLAAGMDDFLSKPLGLDLLSRALEAWLPLTRRDAAGEGTDDRRAVVETDPDLLRLIDLEVLHRLSDELGDGSIVGSLIDTYVAELPDRLNELIAAAASEDLAAVERAAHTLKSTSAMLGAVALNALAAELELVSTEARVVGLSDLVERLVGVAEPTRRFLGEASAQLTLRR